MEELLSPHDRNKKDSTTIMEIIVTIAVKDTIKEIEDKTKATYKYLSIYGTEYYWEHCPETTNKSMLGKMVTNDIAENSFVGVTPQIQTYGRIGICNDASISGISRNLYLYCPTTKKDPKDGNKGTFHDFPEELRLTAVIEKKGGRSCHTPSK